jgi:hypothetical protein
MAVRRYEHLRDLLTSSPTARVDDVCQAMLRQVEQPGATTVFAHVPDVVALLRDSNVREALLLPKALE